MDNNEIRKANRKAFPKFMLIIVISLIVGGGIGFFSARYDWNTLTSDMKSAGAFFGTYIAPWLILTIAIIMPMVCVPVYRGAKKLLSSWDGENEEASDEIDKNLSIVIWITGAALILSCFLLAALYSRGSSTFENENNIVPFFIGIAAFFTILIEAVLIQQKCVDAAKKTNPEKTVSVYDTKFQKKWMDRCDEAEKIIIGKCAFKAYAATNTVCLVLSIVLSICALVFGIGFLPSFVVCLVWIVNHSVYCKETLKYSKVGNKIS